MHWPNALSSTDSLPWMTVGPGFRLKVLHAGGDDDTRALLMELEPGTVVARHRHHGEVHAFHLQGQRKLLDSGEVIGPGGYVYEPNGNVDSWMAVGAVPLLVFVTVRGSMETFDEQGVVIDTTTTSSIGAAYRRLVEMQPPR